LAKMRSSLLVSSREVKNVWFPVCSSMASTGTTVPKLHNDGEIGYTEDTESRIRTDLLFRPDPALKLSANLYDIYHCCV